MANYRILFRQSVAKDLRSIPTKDVQRILQRVEGLAEDPRPVGVEKLSGDEKYRIRQGNYRILYTIDDDVITVTIVKVGHRRDVYR
ncbi:MAG: type II toxin-antitoxin system RelE/ParE family toxin [Planctomycetales bacterium]|nr:type II toxin-antitoxin system RelE/ParE family toxin [Planctomycetales bacterium]